MVFVPKEQTAGQEQVLRAVNPCVAYRRTLHFYVPDTSLAAEQLPWDPASELASSEESLLCAKDQAC